MKIIDDLQLKQKAGIYTEHPGRKIPGAPKYKRKLTFDFKVIFNYFVILYADIQFKYENVN